MQRTIVVAEPDAIVSLDAAEWIRENVLPRELWGQKEEQPWVFEALVVTCPCMWGTCHYCQTGEHGQCLHRRPGGGHRVASSDAAVISRGKGGRYWRADVWDLNKKPCVWLCWCPTCHETPPYTAAADFGLPKLRKTTLDGHEQAGLF